MSPRGTGAGLVAAALLAVACGRGPAPARPVPGGDASRGKIAIVEAGCGSCHTIPGIRGARGVVGPPLSFFSRRTYIGGMAPNDADHLVRWIIDPQSIAPGTAMPQLGLNEPMARDIAAYLYTLR